MLQRFTANFSSLITNALSSVQFLEEEDNDKEEKKIAPNLDSGTNMEIEEEELFNYAWKEVERREEIKKKENRERQSQWRKERKEETAKREYENATEPRHMMLNSTPLLQTWIVYCTVH